MKAAQSRNKTVQLLLCFAARKEHISFNIFVQILGHILKLFENLQKISDSKSLRWKTAENLDKICSPFNPSGKEKARVKSIVFAHSISAIVYFQAKMILDINPLHIIQRLLSKTKNPAGCSFRCKKYQNLSFIPFVSILIRLSAGWLSTY